MEVKGNHPLAEILAQNLFSIETVPPKEQRKMVNRAIKAAVTWVKNNKAVEQAKSKFSEESVVAIDTKADCCKRYEYRGKISPGNYCATCYNPLS